MKRVLYVFANAFGGIVLVLLVLDPSGPWLRYLACSPLR